MGLKKITRLHSSTSTSTSTSAFMLRLKNPIKNRMSVLKNLQKQTFKIPNYYRQFRHPKAINEKNLNFKSCKNCEKFG